MESMGLEHGLNVGGGAVVCSTKDRIKILIVIRHIVALEL